MSALHQAEWLLQKLIEKGHLAYIVGGAVRDYLLKRPNTDIDIVTSATPAQIKECFNDTIQMNTRHQTVIVRHNSNLYEVTTKRGKSIEEDLMRRDFTINSLAMDIKGEILDPTSGQADMQKRLLRTNQPFERMSEDPLRMLRALRFISELGYQLDHTLFHVIFQEHYRLKNVAIERIVKEFEKLVSGAYRKQALEWLKKTKLYVSLPNMDIDFNDIDILQSLPSFPSHSSTLCWTIICRCFGWKGDHLKALTLSKRLVQQVNQRLYYMNYRETDEWDAWQLYQATLEVALEVEQLRELFGMNTLEIKGLYTLWESLPIKQKSDLKISGKDILKQRNQHSGPWVKAELDWAEYAVVVGICPNDRTILLEELARRDRNT